MIHVCLMYPIDNSRKDSKIRWEVAETLPFDKPHERNIVAFGECASYETASKQMTQAVQKITNRK